MVGGAIVGLVIFYFIASNFIFPAGLLRIKIMELTIGDLLLIIVGLIVILIGGIIGGIIGDLIKGRK